MPKKPFRTLLHRLFRLEPGRVPRILCSGCECSGLDLLGFVGAGLFMAAIAVWQVSWILSVVLLTVFACFLELSLSFESSERFARARLRRGECINCGAGKEEAEGDRCAACGENRVEVLQGEKKCTIRDEH